MTDFKYVHSGEPIRLYASTYNAMIDAAKAERKRKLSSSQDGLTIDLPYDTLIYNGSDADYPRFSCLALGDVVTLPSDNLAAFQNRQAYGASLPSNADRGKFVITQEPIRAGAIGRAIASGVTICQVELLSPNDINDDYADLQSGTTTNLLGSAFGAAKILWTEPLEDREDPDKPWCLVCLDSNTNGIYFPVLVTITDGEAGGTSETCTWTYEVFSLRGKSIDNAMAPTKRRFPNQEYEHGPDLSEGACYYNKDGELVLWDANEVPYVADCESDTIILDGGDEDSL